MRIRATENAEGRYHQVQTQMDSQISVTLHQISGIQSAGAYES